MITVQQSETGQFVLTHVPSGTVMLGESLPETWDRMRTHLEAHPTLDPPPTGPPAPAAASGVGRAGRVLIGGLVLLPFVWLGFLHLSMGRLVSDLRVGLEGRATVEKRVERNEAAVRRIEAELGELGRAADSLRSRVTKAERAGAPPRKKAPARKPPAAAPAEEGAEKVPTKTPAAKTPPALKSPPAAARRAPPRRAAPRRAP